MGKPDALSRRSDHGSGTDNNQKDILKEIRLGMESEDQEEVVITAIKELKKSSAKSVRSSEWSLENSLLYYRGKIYVPGAELRHRILTLCHDSKLGTPGGGKPWNWSLETIGGCRCPGT